MASFKRFRAILRPPTRRGVSRIGGDCIYMFQSTNGERKRVLKNRIKFKNGSTISFKGSSGAKDELRGSTMKYLLWK